MAKYMLLSELEKYKHNNYLIVRSNRGAGQRAFMERMKRFCECKEQCDIKENFDGINNDCKRETDTH